MTIASVAVGAAPSLAPSSARSARTDEKDSSPNGFSDALNGAASSQDTDEPAEAQPTSSAPRRLFALVLSASPAKPGDAPKKGDETKDGDTNGLTAQVAVTVPTANPQAPPLQFHFAYGDGHRAPKKGDGTKDADTSGLAVPVAVTTPTTNPQVVLPLQLHFAYRDGQEEPTAESAPGAGQATGNPTLAGRAANAALSAANTALDVPTPAPSLAERPAATAPLQGAGMAAVKTEMAFAARVQPVASTQGTTAQDRKTPETQLATSSASALRKASAPDSDSEPEPKSAIKEAIRAVEPAASQHVAAAFDQGSRTPEIQAQPRAEAVQAPAELAPAKLESPSKTSAPLKDLSLQLTQPGAEKVEVRLVQQAGEVHVAVRTGDTDLAHGLRQSLPELVGKLENSGYRAEAWRPAGSTVGTTPLVQSQSSQSSSGQSHYGESSGRQNGSQQDSGQRNQNPFNRPRWVEELESSVTGTGESTGETNGIGN